MKNYDCVVVIGCSYLQGSNINDDSGRFIGDRYRFSKLLADKYNCKEINLARPGGSNERIFRKLYDWINSSDITYKNPLIILGLTGITRTQIYSTAQKQFFDLHIFDFPNSNKNSDEYIRLYKQRATKLLGDENLYPKLETWVDLTTKYFFDIEVYEKKLQREVLFVDGFLKSRNIDCIVFNSLPLNLEPIRDQINFFSFSVNTESHNYRDTDNINTESLQDCWYHFLRQQQEKITSNFNDVTYRSSVPPYGEWFCGGHPSPNANAVLANMLFEKAESL